MYQHQSKCGGVERLDAEAESDVITAVVGGAIHGVSVVVDTTEITAVARMRRTLPPGPVLHLRVTCLVIGILCSFPRNGIFDRTEDFDFCKQ